jgi:sulfate transport system permease protein
MSRRGVLPGFGLTLGYTVAYLGLLVLIPLAALVLKAAGIGTDRLLQMLHDPRVIAAFRLSFTAALTAATLNAVFGTLLAWVLVRHPLPLRSLVDSLIDLPFALPTAVAGIALTALLVADGPIGRLLGTQLAFTPTGIVIALSFIGLPFVVRSVQPAIEDIAVETEEAAEILGASGLQTFFFVILPRLLPSIVTGFAVAFARGLGEYGSIVFISGNMPMKTEIVPLLIVVRLEQYDYVGAAAIATVLLALSFVTLLSINVLQRRMVTRKV